MCFMDNKINREHTEMEYMFFMAMLQTEDLTFIMEDSKMENIMDLEIYAK